MDMDYEICLNPYCVVRIKPSGELVSSSSLAKAEPRACFNASFEPRGDIGAGLVSWTRDDRAMDISLAEFWHLSLLIDCAISEYLRGAQKNKQLWPLIHGLTIVVGMGDTKSQMIFDESGNIYRKLLSSTKDNEQKLFVSDDLRASKLSWIWMVPTDAPPTPLVKAVIDTLEHPTIEGGFQDMLARFASDLYRLPKIFVAAVHFQNSKKTIRRSVRLEAFRSEIQTKYEIRFPADLFSNMRMVPHNILLMVMARVNSMSCKNKKRLDVCASLVLSDDKYLMALLVKYYKDNKTQ